jgi:hypothetical protein
MKMQFLWSDMNVAQDFSTKTFICEMNLALPALFYVGIIWKSTKGGGAALTVVGVGCNNQPRWIVRSAKHL